jgi:hypothetical protein
MPMIGRDHPDGARRRPRLSWPWRRDQAGAAARLPPGANDVRPLLSSEAEILTQLGALTTATHQSVVALRTLAERRRGAPAGPRSETDEVTDMALLRFALLQFVQCFAVRRDPVKLTPSQAFGSSGARFFKHVRAFADELSGAGPRLVGRVEAVALLRVHEGRAAALSVTTRSRRPDRLTAVELAQLIDFMESGVQAYAERAAERRTTLTETVRAMDPAELVALPHAPD